MAGKTPALPGVCNQEERFMRARVRNGIGLLINAYQLAAICVLLWLLIVAIALFICE